jgi:hypothetical protein
MNLPPEAINSKKPYIPRGDAWEPSEEDQINDDFNSKHIICDCPTPANGMFLYNWKSGHYTKIRCNRYACPVCGKIKVRILYAALYRYFQPKKWMRLWTFTVTTQIGNSEEERFKILSEAFSLLVKEIRRNPLFSKTQQNFCYVKCIDIGENGHCHFHALFDQFLQVKYIWPVWRRLLQRLSGLPGHLGSVKAKGMLTSKAAARYVCKYVLKAAASIEIKCRRYTKSGKMPLFEKRTSNGFWYLVYDSIRIYEAMDFKAASAYFTCNNKDITFQDLSGFGEGP